MGKVGWSLGLGVAAYGALQVLGRRAGSTADERHARRPGDELVASPQLVTDHALTIGAPPEEIWPWLTQMGWHRAGFYTPEWVRRDHRARGLRHGERHATGASDTRRSGLIGYSNDSSQAAWRPA